MRLIDADALIQEWYRVNNIDEDDRGARFIGYTEIPRFIANAPTVSAESVQGWIPVSDRLPDSDRPVLVTIQWTDFDREVTVGEYWDNPAKAAPESEKGWGTYGDHVTAWREMPEPYKEGNNE